MYYGGIDLGTSSVGWALTDMNYRLIRKRGKDLWGVRLFDEAKSAQERRSNRTARRRRARETARIGLLKSYFADEIDKVDTGFYQRLEESKYHKEDKKTGNRFAVFADREFTDREYYETFPTVFHLRKELLESDAPFDVRLVYLAVLNLFKHRGHFLNEYLEWEEHDKNMADLFREFYETLPEESELHFPQTADWTLTEEILGSRLFSRSEKAEKLAACLGIVRNQNKAEYEMIKLFCGMSGKPALIFGQEIAADAYRKKQLSFRSSSCEEEMEALGDCLPEGYMDMIEAAKRIHDKGLLAHILKGHTYLSQARVETYEKHKEDLKKLRYVMKKYCKDEYDAYFRTMTDHNYSGYVGSVNSGKEKIRRNRGAKKEAYKAFWKETKRLLNLMPQEDQEVFYLKQELEKETLLPKQRTFENGVIPNQVHLAELKKILSNAEKYLPFLREKDENGLTVTERICKLFAFRIPYYVGPLSVKGGEGRNWIQRKETGRVLPWNMEEKIDMAKTREAFILKMVRQCTYMKGKYVLPKNSLRYEAFMVLNELNNVKIRGEKLDVGLKQKIYRELFLTGKKVTGKKLFQYLCVNGILSPDEQEAVTGIDETFHQSLTSYGRFRSILGDEIENREMQKMAEQIIFWGTVYSNDKKMSGELMREAYGELSEKQYLTESQIRRISGFKWKDWGRLSKDFLELQGCSRKDGVKRSLIRALWETDCNLMELLGAEFTFRDSLTGQIQEQEKLLGEFCYHDLEDSYLSAPVRRMVWQTILIWKELCQLMGEAPARLFVEMPRGEGEKGKRTVSRKKRLEELYQACKADSRNWLKEIQDLSEDDLRSRKLYLYYTQRGRCMYTGHPISLEDLLLGNQYDIDHIYPRHFLKDDSLENNLVLVEKESNGHKSDTFPIEASVRRDRQGLWKSLKDGGFISQEKYKRLTRSWDFTDEELAGFISRQIVETGQATKYITGLLDRLLPETEIVFVKAGNVSAFRHQTELLKSRLVNDFHHAHDAYLNIVVGNVYYTKFTQNPANFIRAYRRDQKGNAYHMDKLFWYDVVRNGAVAWKAGQAGTIGTVRAMMARNTPLLTKRVYEAHGGIAEQTIYSAGEAKERGYIPVKSGDERLRDVTKYGGFSSVSGAYYFLVEHEKKGKRVRTLEQMPIYLKTSLEKDEEAWKNYCIETLGLVSPEIRWKKIRMRSLVKRNGYLMNLAGRTGRQIYAENAVSLCLSQKWVNYIKGLENFKESGKEEDRRENKEKRITKEKNELLYQELVIKHRDTIYRRKPNPIWTKLIEKQAVFAELSVREQVNVLLELLKVTQCQNLSMDAKEIGVKASPDKIGIEVTAQEEFLLIDQSVTGIYSCTIDLKTI